MIALPGDLAEIAAIAGREAALSLARHLGGERIYIPVNRAGKAWDQLVAAVGVEAALLIARHFTRESIYVPKARKALVPWLNRHGLSPAEIKADLGLGGEAVRRYLLAA